MLSAKAIAVVSALGNETWYSCSGAASSVGASMSRCSRVRTFSCRFTIDVSEVSVSVLTESEPRSLDNMVSSATYYRRN